MAVNRAEYYWRQGWMSDDFIENLARRYLGDEVVDSLPCYVRGKRKGKLKGQLEWVKVAKQGWCRTGGRTDDGYAAGFVEFRLDTIIKVELVMPVWGKNPEVFTFPFGFQMSSSVWAMLRSPQTKTGSVLLTYCCKKLLHSSIHPSLYI